MTPPPETLAADVEGLAELERLAKAATPGPWEIAASKYPVDGAHDFAITQANVRGVLAECFGRMGETVYLPAEANAAFIAAANPAAILKLIAALRSITETNRVLKKAAEKRAPVQGFAGGIPWEMHLRAYDAYCKKWSPQSALIDLEGRNCRGGFGVNELDDFIPGWRAELSELTALRERVAELEAALKVGASQ